MHLFSTYHFDLLKKELTEKADMAYITPADCKALSLALFNKTQKSISETTLKRIFGFAYSKFTPSLFTMNALAEFCGYTGWDAFCQSRQKTPAKKQSSENKPCSITAKAERITNFTLQTQINHSGIPFQYTIPRKFVDEQLSIFMQQPYTATIFTAPAGYGKTIGLCHWVKELVKTNTDKENKDIILFFNGNTINSSLQNIHLNHWLMGLIGLSPDEDLEGLADMVEGFTGRFILIIDGFDDFHFRSNNFETTFNQLADIINMYHKYPWFKVILTMRSSTWSSLREDIMAKPETWFTGFMMDHEQKRNVPPFSSEQFKKLCENINPNIAHEITLPVIDKLSTPLYFQYYYQRYSDNFSLSHFNDLTYYHLVAANYYHSVYKGHYAIEKVLLITGIINQMDTDNNVYEVNKLRVHELIKRYGSAYQEMISSGIVEELNLSRESKLNFIVKMSDEVTLDYALAMILMYNNNYVFNDNLIHLADLVFSREKKLPIIKWFIYNAIYKDYEFDLKALLSVQMLPAEKSEFISFIGELLKLQRDNHTKSERMQDLFRQVCSEDFFNYFISLEFVDIGYERVLETFLHFSLSTQQQILIKTCLSVIAVMQLDLAKLEKHLNDLKQYSQKSLQNLPINPINCIETILFYLKYGIVKKDALIQITKFYFNPVENTDTSKGFTEVVYLLALYTSTICQKHNKAAKLINGLNKVYPDHSAGYAFILKTIMAEAYLASGYDVKAREIFNEISDAYNEEDGGFTTFMKVLYEGLKIKLTLPTDNHITVVNNIKNLIKVCDDSRQIIVKVNTLGFILANYAILKENVYVFNDLYFDFIKSIRNNGCRTEHFMTDEIKWAETRTSDTMVSRFNSFELNKN
ncbi:NACHT domain-containing protein [Mucilaginibacter celer]|uniref:NACHT domain-containing protein n=1 Tax=Mucilaginibacter celer TaxID=2305508 RepID=A0A494VSR6_9SPHI|nr:NACHT domain-containing protein [Mucilaginibacter celer]AYL96440.1 NACHT domain-containing protein [Mucilaginibacter celer]